MFAARYTVGEFAAMTRIPALDEITEQLGAPAALRWMDAPKGTQVAVARFRHRGGAIDLSASGTFRLIFHVSNSEADVQEAEALPFRRSSQPGSVATEFTNCRSRVRVHTVTDTVHLLFSPELARGFRITRQQQLSAGALRTLRAAAIQTLAGMNARRADRLLDRALSSVLQTMTQHAKPEQHSGGGLSPQANRAVRALMMEQMSQGVSVNELAAAAGLSVHHFIKACRRSEGFTPHALLLELRMQRALAMLAKPGARVDEVAYLTGFYSPSHFVSAFRRITGVTPAVFRDAVAA